MLDCFDGLTGLANTCDTYATSPVVPLESFGINETLISQFIGPEDTVASFLSGAEKQARLTIKSDVLSRYASRVIPRTFLHAQRVGEPDGHQTLVTGATGLNGILVEVNQRAGNVRLALTGWRFYAAATGAVTVHEARLCASRGRTRRRSRPSAVRTPTSSSIVKEVEVNRHPSTVTGSRRTSSNT